MSRIRVRTVSVNGTFDDVIAGSTPEVRRIARALRALIADVMPGVAEVPWRRQKNVGYGVGPRKMSEHFCYVLPYEDYVNLGFMQGARLRDPEGLLEGSGKLLRHVKVRSLADAAHPSLRELVEQAAARRAG